MPLFDISVIGQQVPDESPAAVAQRLAGLFKITVDQAASVLARRATIKRGVDEATARRFEAALGRIGVRCEVRAQADGVSTPSTATATPADASSTPPPASPSPIVTTPAASTKADSRKRSKGLWVVLGVLAAIVYGLSRLPWRDIGAAMSAAADANETAQCLVVSYYLPDGMADTWREAAYARLRTLTERDLQTCLENVPTIQGVDRREVLRCELENDRWVETARIKAFPDGDSSNLSTIRKWAKSEYCQTLARDYAAAQKTKSANPGAASPAPPVAMNETPSAAPAAPNPALKLPFVGTREFNFSGGTATQESITIEGDGTTKIVICGDASLGGICNVEYAGPFKPEMRGDNGRGWIIKDGKIGQMHQGQAVMQCGDDGTEWCVQSLDP